MTDLSLFFGAFHPVVVHLPIGCLVVAALLQVLSALKPDVPGIRQVLPWLYGIGALGAVAAVISGWLLAGPLGASWDTHRYFGLGTLALNGLLFGLSLRQTQATHAARSSDRWALSGLAVLTLGVVAWTGHLGGGLTHGDGHFEQYAPAGLRPAVSEQSPVSVLARDSVSAYTTLVQPIFTDKCVDCHRAGYAQGSLRLDSYAALKKGGSEGDASRLSGELWRRVTLPADHARFMPTRGIPLSYDELAILQRFLGSGADSSAPVAALDWTEEQYAAIERRYRTNARELPYIDRVRPPEVDISTQPSAWSLRKISQQHTLLDAQLRQRDKPATELAAALAPYADNVATLDLRGLTGADDVLVALPDMPHLVSVDLTRSDVTATGREALSRFTKLEDINVWATELYSEGDEQRIATAKD